MVPVAWCELNTVPGSHVIGAGVVSHQPPSEAHPALPDDVRDLDRDVSGCFGVGRHDLDRALDHRGGARPVH
jgi:hypothetical protein